MDETNPLNKLAPSKLMLDMVEEAVAGMAEGDTRELIVTDDSYPFPHLFSPPTLSLRRKEDAGDDEAMRGWGEDGDRRTLFLCPDCTTRYYELARAEAEGEYTFDAEAYAAERAKYGRSEHDMCVFCQQAVETVVDFARYRRRPGWETDAEKQAEEIAEWQRTREWEKLFAVSPPEGRRIDEGAEWVRIVALPDDVDREGLDDTLRIGSVHLASEELMSLGANNARCARIQTPSGELRLMPHEFQVVSIDSVEALGGIMETVVFDTDPKLDADSLMRMFYIRSRGIDRQSALLAVAVAWKIPGVACFVPAVNIDEALAEAKKLEKAKAGDKRRKRWSEAAERYLAHNDIAIKPGTCIADNFVSDWGLIGVSYQLADGQRSFFEGRISSVAAWLEPVAA
jgi:hypothetical protein